MKIKEFRLRFPDYGDLTDAELAKLAATILSDVMDDDYNEAQLVNAPETVSAINEVYSELETANAALKTINDYMKAVANKKDREEKDLTPHLMALAVQMQNVEAAIKAIKMPELPASQEMKSMPMCTSFKIKRDEIGNIDSVIPVYEA